MSVESSTVKYLMHEAGYFPRRLKAAQILFDIYSNEKHPFIRQLRWEDLRQRVLSPTPFDRLVDRMDLIKDRVIGVFKHPDTRTRSPASRQPAAA